MRQNIIATGLWSAFWSKVSFPRGGRGCWLWTGMVTGNGYGMINMYKSSRCAHHVAWAMMRGCADGLHIMHSCDVRTCVNPAHLSLGTNAENAADRHRKGRSTIAGVTVTGPMIHRAIVLRGQGLTHRAIAAELGVTRTAITKALIRHRDDARLAVPV